MNAPRPAWRRRAAAAPLTLLLATSALSLIASPTPAAADAGPADTWGHFQATSGLGAIADGTGTCASGNSGGTKVVPINVSGLPTGKRITDVVLHIGISHTAVGDLGVSLKAPNGFNQDVFDHTGAASNTTCGDTTNLNGVYDFEDGQANLWWQEAASKDTNGIMTPGYYAASGRNGGAAVSLVQNFQNLPNVNGTWALEIDDYHKADVGSVGSVKLSIAVDTTPNDTLITAGPANGETVSTFPTYKFGAPFASDAGSYQCRFDPGPLTLWSSCTSPWSPTGRLSTGEHTFQVRSVDTSGNADATPATRTFIYAPPDTTPPETVITGGPASGATVTSPPTYAFSSPSADADHLECQVDSGSWTTCTSPFTPSVQAGSHTFSVRAVDASGNVDPTPASTAFTLTTGGGGDTTPPDTQITGGPAQGATVSGPPSYSFSSPDADATSFRCAVDNGPFTACTSPKSAGAAEGTHTFKVAAVDGAGNVDPTPATRTYTLTSGGGGDTTPPDTQVTSGPANGASVTSVPTYGFSSPDNDVAGFRCSVDGAAFTACTSPRTVSVAEGTHTFAVAAVDGAGNVDPTPASRTFTLETEVDEQCDQALLDLAGAKIWKVKAKKRLDRALDSGNMERIRKARRNLRQAIRAVREAKADVAQYC